MWSQGPSLCDVILSMNCLSDSHKMLRKNSSQKVSNTREFRENWLSYNHIFLGFE
jgi:hypothetical protein